MARLTNQQLAANFRELLTHGFFVNDVDGVPSTKSHTLAATKNWRNELWKAFHEIEDRLDPLGAMERNRKYFEKVKNEQAGNQSN